MEFLKNPAFWMFVAAVVLINTFISPRNVDNWGGFIRVTGIVSVAAFLYVSCHVGLFYQHARIFSEKRTVVYYPLFWIFLIVLIVVTFVVWMAQILEPYDVPNFNGVREMYPVVLIRLMIFEWLFYCFFVPIIEKRGATQDIETVVLGDHTLNVLDILYIKAMEHRVWIYTKESELVERSRFRDLMQILNDIDGVQPHRSYWVPAHAILHLEGDADRLNIVLISGDKIAVARTRRSEIEDWAKEKALLIRALD